MNKKLVDVVRKLLTVAVVVVGVYMLLNHAWPTPPAVSGLGFVFVGLALCFSQCCCCKKPRD